jgi:hypothetical protein
LVVLNIFSCTFDNCSSLQLVAQAGFVTAQPFFLSALPGCLEREIPHLPAVLNGERFPYGRIN